MLRASCLIAILAVVACHLLVNPTLPTTSAQFPPPPGPMGQPENELEPPERAKIPKDKSAERRLREAQRFLDQRDWNSAIELLQEMIDEKEDKFTKGSDGRYTSIRAESNRILASMPKDGLDQYEQTHGGTARNLLKQGLAAGDPRLLGEVAQRYHNTQAGFDATVHLGTYHLDHGRYFVAALFFDRLLQSRDGHNRLPLIGLFKAALALDRVGQNQARDDVWRSFLRRLPRESNSLPAGLRRLDRDELWTAVTTKNAGFHSRRLSDWPLFGGIADRTGLGAGSAPFLEKRLEFPMTEDAKTKGWIDSASQRVKQQNLSIVNGFHPISVGDHILFRTFSKVHCVNTKTGRNWHTLTLDGSLDWIDGPLNRSNRDQMKSWIDQYLLARPSILLENSLVGTLSSDGERVFLVEDLAVPPFPQFQQFQPRPVGMAGDWGSNALTSINLHDGKILWEIGRAKAGEPYGETYFLGPPLPLGGQLYVMAEVNSEIRLLCIEPQKGGLVWSQMLCYVERKFGEDPIRRIHAAHLAYADGILVCPTNAGIVIGVDLLSRTLVWAQTLHQVQPVAQPNPNFGFQPVAQVQQQEQTWSCSGPMIKDGNVVITTYDGRKVHCLDLHTGKQNWSIDKASSDILVAGVFQDKVVVVGKDVVRGYTLDAGKELWRRAVPSIPAGRGVANAATYYQPLADGKVIAIHLQDGIVQGVSESSKGDTPGNLVFHQGEVISQSLSSVVVYPQLTVKENEIASLLEKNPGDPRGLTERAELRLHRNDVASAIDDLQLAIKNKPDETLLRRTRQKYYEGLTILLERDFAKSEHLLAEYQEMIEIHPLQNEEATAKERREKEVRERKARYQRLVAKGREAQGRLRDSFAAYLEFVKLSGNQLVSVTGDPAAFTPAENVVRHSLEAMYQKATPAQRAELDAVVREEWTKLEKNMDLNMLKSFAQLFDGMSAEGARARILLADKFLERSQLAEAQVALLSLVNHPEPQVSAQAYEKLARLCTRNGNLHDAVFYYRQLAQLHPKVVVVDNKTGEELFSELATDKRFLPYLDEIRRTWIPGKEVRASYMESGTGIQNFLWFEPQNVIPPALQKYRLGIRMGQNPATLQFVDRRTGKDEFSLTMKGAMVNPYVQNFRGGVRALHAPPYWAVGPYLVFRWSHWAYCIDPATRREVWSIDLLGKVGDTARANQQLIFNEKGDLLAQTHQGIQHKVGNVGLVSSVAICLTVRDQGLIAIDPATGERKWIKTDVPEGCKLYGDERILLIVREHREGEVPSYSLLRPADATPINEPGLQKILHKNLGIFGRFVLHKDPEPQGQMLKLHDIESMRTVWSRPFPEGSSLLSTHTQGYLGVLERNGRWTILDKLTGKELCSGSNNDLTSDALLFADDFNVYLVASQGAKANMQNRFANYFLRFAPAGGSVVAVDRSTGKVNWQLAAPEGHLLVDQFEDSPIMIFLQQNMQNARPGVTTQELTVEAVNKRTGQKAVVKSSGRAYLQLMLFTLDRPRNRVELLAHNARFVFDLSDNGQAAVDKPMGAVPIQPKPEAVQPIPARVQPVPVQVQPVPVQIRPGVPVPAQKLPVQIKVLPAIQPPPVPPAPVPAVPAQPVKPVQRIQIQLQPKVRPVVPPVPEQE